MACLWAGSPGPRGIKMASCFLFSLISLCSVQKPHATSSGPAHLKKHEKDFELPGPGIWTPGLSSLPSVRGRQHALHLLINSADQVTCLGKPLRCRLYFTISSDAWCVNQERSGKLFSNRPPGGTAGLWGGHRSLPPLWACLKWSSVDVLLMGFARLT